MKRVLHWLKAAWVWLFEDVRTEMRWESTPDDAGKHDDGGEQE